MSLLLLPVRRPLLPLITVSAVTGRDTDGVMRLIDSGDLQFGFNLQSGVGARQCVRVLAQSVADFLQGKRELKSLEDALRLILPGMSEHVTTAALARAMCCSTEHVARLFDGQRKPSPGRGCNSSPIVTRREVAKLLKERRIL